MNFGIKIEKFYYAFKIDLEIQKKNEEEIVKKTNLRTRLSLVLRMKGLSLPYIDVTN